MNKIHVITRNEIIKKIIESKKAKLAKSMKEAASLDKKNN